MEMDERDDMVKRLRGGESLGTVGARYGISRQGVESKLQKYLGDDEYKEAMRESLAARRDPLGIAPLIEKGMNYSEIAEQIGVTRESAMRRIVRNSELRELYERKENVRREMMLERYGGCIVCGDAPRDAKGANKCQREFCRWAVNNTGIRAKLQREMHSAAVARHALKHNENITEDEQERYKAFLNGDDVIKGSGFMRCSLSLDVAAVMVKHDLVGAQQLTERELQQAEAHLAVIDESRLAFLERML